VLAGASIVWTTLTLGASPVPTSWRVRRALLELAPRELEGEVLELGSGWGGLACALADALPRARVTAWEASWVPFAFSWLWSRLRPRPNLTLRRGDFFEADLSRAALVTCYLIPRTMLRLEAKFRAELPPGAVILSSTFALRGWTPAARRVLPDLYRTQVFKYVIAADREGRGACATETRVP
jgi:Methyltransferase small domain